VAKIAPASDLQRTREATTPAAKRLQPPHESMHWM
jgi:hypothetical protein